jgi:hypothetical protein
MRSLSLIALLCSVSCASGKTMRNVVFLEGSEDSPMLACFPMKDESIHCLDGKRFFQMVIQHMTQEEFEDLKLQAPDRAQ